jgi:hypothetical protein
MCFAFAPIPAPASLTSLANALRACAGQSHTWVGVLFVVRVVFSLTRSALLSFSSFSGRAAGTFGAVAARVAAALCARCGASGVGAAARRRQSDGLALQLSEKRRCAASRCRGLAARAGAHSDGCRCSGERRKDCLGCLSVLISACQMPDFAVLLSRNEGASALSCHVVRRRGGEAQPLSEAETAELEQLGRALAIWIWMKGSEKK